MGFVALIVGVIAFVLKQSIDSLFALKMDAARRTFVLADPASWWRAGLVLVALGQASPGPGVGVVRSRPLNPVSKPLALKPPASGRGLLGTSYTLCWRRCRWCSSSPRRLVYPPLIRESCAEVNKGDNWKMQKPHRNQHDSADRSVQICVPSVYSPSPKGQNHRQTGGVHLKMGNAKKCNILQSV